MLQSTSVDFKVVIYTAMRTVLLCQGISVIREETNHAALHQLCGRRVHIKLSFLEMTRVKVVV